MNLYMKSVLSETMVDEKLQGIPIGFLLTSIQQFVAFAAFAAFMLFSHLTGTSYKPKPLKLGRKEGRIRSTFFFLAAKKLKMIRNFLIRFLISTFFWRP